MKDRVLARMEKALAWDKQRTDLEAEIAKQKKFTEFGAQFMDRAERAEAEVERLGGLVELGDKCVEEYRHRAEKAEARVAELCKEGE